MTPTLTRRSDWEQQLSAYLASVADTAHAYGAHDCLIDKANAIRAMTGTDLAKGHRGKYRSAASSGRYLRSLGFDSFEALIDSMLPEKPVAFAQRGDIVLDDEGVPGLCIGGEALFIGEDGRVRKPRRDWRKAWAV